MIPCFESADVVQVQAIAVGLAAAVFSIIMGVILHGEFNIMDCFLLIGSSIATASIASGLLGLVVVVLVLVLLVCSGAGGSGAAARGGASAVAGAARGVVLLEHSGS